MMNSPRRGPGRQEGQRRRSGPDTQRQNTERYNPKMDALCRKVVLVPPEGQALAPDLFDGIAEEAAKIVAKDETRTSQLRKFYDELLRWEAKVNDGAPDGARDRLREHLPFIRMMNAKAAYANGRKLRGRSLVGMSFVTLLRRCLEQVDDAPKGPHALRNSRLFFEAFMGFYKRHGPQE